MSVILEFSIDPDEFRLGQALAATTTQHIELERIVPMDSPVMPFVWVTTDDFDVFERELRTQSQVEELLALDQLGDRGLYRITWSAPTDGLTRGLTETEATVLEAFCDDAWVFRVRFSDHDRLSAFHNFCTDHDVPIHIDRTYTLTEETGGEHRFGLTPEQREALVLALDRGYFATPREETLEDLADELDISPQAISNRIRRGNEKVLASTLLSSAADS